MASKHLIKLYDISSKHGTVAWSPNSWRVRFVLNYKRLPYTTEWVHYPDITRTLAALGVAPNRTPTGQPHYTIPALTDETAGRPPVRLSDSATIADYLEGAYPARTIYPGGRDAQMAYAGIVNRHFMMKAAFMVTRHCARIFEPHDGKYFVASRKFMFGVDFADMYPEHKQEETWADIADGLDKVFTAIDTRKASGDWLFGDAQGPGYADFVLGATYLWVIHGGPEGAWERLRALNGGRWGSHFESLTPYLQVL